MSSPLRCPCESGEAYADCCGRYHAGPDQAPTAERLMRARYSAFALGDLDYVARTWHASTRPLALRDEPDLVWLGLRITGCSAGGLFDTEGTVEFRADYRVADEPRPTHMAERSRFVREDGRWWYVEPVTVA